MENLLRGLLHAWNGDFANFREAIQSELTIRAAGRIEDMTPSVAQSMFEDCYHSQGKGETPLQWSVGDKSDRVHTTKKHPMVGKSGDDKLPKARAGKRRADPANVRTAK